MPKMNANVYIDDKDNVSKNEKNVEIIYRPIKNNINSDFKKENIDKDESNKIKQHLVNELHNIKNNLFSNSPFSNYIHFYEIYNNLKYIVKYERKKNAKELFSVYSTRKKYICYLIYLILLLLNICLLFRLQTVIKFPFWYNYYYFYEINFHVFFTFFVLAYCVFNAYLFIFTYKELVYHINIMCIIIIQTLYNIYIKEKNKEIYRNTEMLIEGCNRIFTNLDKNFPNIILLRTDHIFNKFTNIFKYISKRDYEYETLYSKYEDTAIKIDETKGITSPWNNLSSDETDQDSEYKNKNKKKKKKHTVVINIKNPEVYKKLINESINEQIPGYNNNGNSNKKSIYNIFGNSIYSNIYDINIYMRHRKNYIHSLIISKCKEKINYIQFIFYFMPYVINLFINVFTIIYILFSVYYYNNMIPLAPPYELSKLHIFNILNYRGIYYILFIFFLNFFFFLYSLFLYKLNTTYFFLRQIYKQCKYESTYYCEHIMNEIYEKYIFSEIIKTIFDKNKKNSVQYKNSKKERHFSSLKKVTTHIDNNNHNSAPQNGVIDKDIINSNDITNYFRANMKNNETTHDGMHIKFNEIYSDDTNKIFQKEKKNEKDVSSCIRCFSTS
ncbi:conserved Plasmodium protein, unknown function [Plasmodium chabaudi adami]|uniref:Uncharacterized protein n=1 Tax=Plasmodium chabaudi adami TaxID=5826 RepID=A0A1C6Y9V9_PLACE|nr:conserved Plasmodium protein, unknown function [Plasmodium chabaudi adami]